MVMVLSFSCGKEKRGNVVVEDVTSEVAAVFQEYYEKNFDPACSGKLIGDFNGDGKSELVTVSYVKNENGFLENYIVAYYRIKNGAMIRDWNVIDSSRPGFPSPFEISDAEKQTGGNSVKTEESLQIYANDKGYFCAVLAIQKGDCLTASYIVFTIEDEQVTVVRNLFEPGEDPAPVLYAYEDYFGSDASKNALYAENGSGNPYPDYIAALNAEIGSYGFVWTQNENRPGSPAFLARGQITEAEPVRLLLSYTTA